MHFPVRADYSGLASHALLQVNVALSDVVVRLVSSVLHKGVGALVCVQYWPKEADVLAALPRAFVAGDQLVAAERNGNLWKVAFNLSDRANPLIIKSVALATAGARNWVSLERARKRLIACWDRNGQGHL